MKRFDQLFHANSEKARFLRSLAAGASFYNLDEAGGEVYSLFLAADNIAKEELETFAKAGSHDINEIYGEFYFDDVRFESGLGRQGDSPANLVNSRFAKDAELFIADGTASDVMQGTRIDQVAVALVNDLINNQESSNNLDALRVLFNQSSPELAEKHFSSLSDPVGPEEALASVMGYLKESRQALRDDYINNPDNYDVGVVLSQTIAHNELRGLNGVPWLTAISNHDINRYDHLPDFSGKAVKAILERPLHKIAVSPQSVEAIATRGRIENDLGSYKTSNAFAHKAKTEADVDFRDFSQGFSTLALLRKKAIQDAETSNPSAVQVEFPMQDGSSLVLPDAKYLYEKLTQHFKLDHDGEMCGPEHLDYDQPLILAKDENGSWRAVHIEGGLVRAEKGQEVKLMERPTISVRYLDVDEDGLDDELPQQLSLTFQDIGVKTTLDLDQYMDSLVDQMVLSQSHPDKPVDPVKIQPVKSKDSVRPENQANQQATFTSEPSA